MCIHIYIYMYACISHLNYLTAPRPKSEKKSLPVSPVQLKDFGDCKLNEWFISINQLRLLVTQIKLLILVF